MTTDSRFIQEWVCNRLYWPTNPAATEAQVTFPRWWIDDKVLVGGSLQSPEDWKHLVDAVGIRSVLSVESERSDEHAVNAAAKQLRMPFEDNGAPISPGIVRRVIEFARESLPLGPMYVHCQGGGSRSPAIAYAILRALMGLSQEEALGRIRRVKTEYHTGAWQHAAYLSSVETVLATELQ
jgi:protein-tyrosine phosphatase